MRFVHSVQLLLVLSLILSACSVGPDYTPPDIDLPERWSNILQQPEQPERPDLIEYWKQLNDNTLDMFIEKGLTENLTLQEVSYRIDEAFALYGVNRSEYFPDIDLNATLQRRRRSEAVASAIQTPRNDLLAAGGVLGWEIDLLGRIRRLNESAQAQLDARYSEYNAAIVTLCAEIASSYIQFRTLQSQINLTQKNIGIQKESLDIANERLSAGVTPELDVYQAESNLGQTQAALPLLRISRIREINRLAVLLGTYPEDIELLISAVHPIPEAPSAKKGSLPLDSIRQRPDLRQAERELAAQHALIGASIAELYPIISLPGFFSFEALQTLEDAFRVGSVAYAIGPRVSLNFLDFGRVRGNIKIQEARTLQIESRYKQLVLRAVQEVEDALIAKKEERRRAMFLDNSVEASRKSAALVRSLYVAGLTDFQNVLDSERTLFEQEIELAQSHGNTTAAWVALFRALGGGWQQADPSSKGNETDPSPKEDQTRE